VKKESAYHDSYGKSSKGLNKGPLCGGCETAFGIDGLVVRVGKLSPVLSCLVQKATQNRGQVTLQQSFPKVHTCAAVYHRSPYYGVNGDFECHVPGVTKEFS